MKVRYLKGDTKGQEGYLDYHSVQAALQGDPDSLEILDGYPSIGGEDSGNPAGNAETGAVTRHPAAARDLADETDSTLVTTAGHGTGGADAMRMGPSVVHRAEALDPGPLTNRAAPGAATPASAKGQDARAQSMKAAKQAADTQNAAADEAAKLGERDAKRADKNRS